MVVETTGNCLFHLTSSLLKMLEGKKTVERQGKRLHPLRGLREEEQVSGKPLGTAVPGFGFTQGKVTPRRAGAAPARPISPHPAGAEMFTGTKNITRLEAGELPSHLNLKADKHKPSYLLSPLPTASFIKEGSRSFIKALSIYPSHCKLMIVHIHWDVLNKQ